PRGGDVAEVHGPLPLVPLAGGGVLADGGDVDGHGHEQRVVAGAAHEVVQRPVGGDEHDGAVERVDDLAGLDERVGVADGVQVLHGERGVRQARCAGQQPAGADDGAGRGEPLPHGHLMADDVAAVGGGPVLPAVAEVGAAV